MAAGMAEDGTVLDLNSVFEAVARFKAGKINEEELHSLECRACPAPVPAPACLRPIP